MKKLLSYIVLFCLLIISVIFLQHWNSYTDSVNEYNQLKNKCIEAYFEFEIESNRLLDSETSKTDKWFLAYTTYIIALDRWNDLYLEFGEKNCLPDSIYDFHIPTTGEKMLEEKGYNDISYELAVVNEIEYYTIILAHDIWDYYTATRVPSEIYNNNKTYEELKHYFEIFNQQYEVLSVEMKKSFQDMLQFYGIRKL